MVVSASWRERLVAGTKDGPWTIDVCARLWVYNLKHPNSKLIAWAYVFKLVYKLKHN